MYKLSDLLKFLHFAWFGLASGYTLLSFACGYELPLVWYGYNFIAILMMYVFYRCAEALENHTNKYDYREFLRE